ncbi:mucolipin-3 isoform X2 [Esox lucius]|nr:mucolipin-3 isoform X2 [Esox lucius]XP_010900411.2 mucolipin-3 isoform X2 [Esox lucius]XP_010900412.2 mucolipin-3 isoform X2 [Esox lucius]XP_012990541.2 mucolipin-3 isoform X2 [Esox lucius]
MEESCGSYASVYEPNGHTAWADHQQRQEQEISDNLRRKIKYFFMNPCEKYVARGRKPWKLMLQIIKIAVITIQLVSFGLSNQMVVTFKEENLMTFNHLFLKDYVDGRGDSYALYRQDEVYEHIHYIVEKYSHLRNITVGNHAYEKIGDTYTPLSLCQEFYRNGSISPANETFKIDAQIETECLEIFPVFPMDRPIEEDLLNFVVHFNRLLNVKIKFTLKAINLQTVRHRELPNCYDFDVSITFNNQAHSGRIKVDLDNDVDINECRDWKVTGASPKNIYYPLVFDCLIIITCIASLTLCTRSVLKGIQLQFEYTDFCHVQHGKQVPWSDRLEFLNGWYILIIISDTLSIIGSILKIEIQTKVLTNYDVCSIFLGTGTMFVWIGVIRYMGYFKKYNILILTLRAAFPNVVRFIGCAGIIYLGYCFCGWIVLGPYHEKFRTLNTVSECLFSLINGDDMFPTFKHMQQKSYLVWLFSRVYLYTFVSLFIYMILSLFITLITDTYDTIKHQQQDWVPVSELHAFVSECKDLPTSGRYRVEGESGSCTLSSFCTPCIPRCNDRRGRLSSDSITDLDQSPDIGS